MHTSRAPVSFSQELSLKVNIKDPKRISGHCVETSDMDPENGLKNEVFSVRGAHQY